VSENLDLVRSIYADWERGDYGSSEWADPAIEYAIDGGPEPGRWKGLAGMAAGVGAYVSVWYDLRVQVEEYRELNDERVLVLDRWVGRGKRSGLDFSRQGPSPRAHLFSISNGKVTHLTTYHERDSALADLGLEE
jgi:hypothetical protein